MSVVPKYVPVGPDFERKVGDTDAFRDILEDEDPVGSGQFGPFDLTSVVSVVFVVKSVAQVEAGSASSVWTKAATVENAPQGIVTVTPDGAHVTAMVAGDYLAYWTVDGKRIPRGRAYRRIVVGLA